MAPLAMVLYLAAAETAVTRMARANGFSSKFPSSMTEILWLTRLPACNRRAPAGDSGANGWDSKKTIIK